MILPLGGIPVNAHICAGGKAAIRARTSFSQTLNKLCNSLEQNALLKNSFILKIPDSMWPQTKGDKTLHASKVKGRQSQSKVTVTVKPRLVVMRGMLPEFNHTHNHQVPYN